MKGGGGKERGKRKDEERERIETVGRRKGGRKREGRMEEKGGGEKGEGRRGREQEEKGE